MSWSVLLHESRSLYEIVGVDSEASSADIKVRAARTFSPAVARPLRWAHRRVTCGPAQRAYRKKALKLHPDKNPSEEARHEVRLAAAAVGLDAPRAHVALLPILATDRSS